jgi:hypothetical protein
MGLSGQIGIHALLTLTKVGGINVTPEARLNYAKNWDVTSGNGADQAEELYYADRTLTTGANEDLDLTGTFFQNDFGANITFTKIKAVLIESLAANTTNITIGAAAATQFVGWFGAATHTIILSPGDFFAIAKRGTAGWAVGAGASDLLRVTNAAGASATYRIIIVGTKT